MIKENVSVCVWFNLPTLVYCTLSIIHSQAESDKENTTMLAFHSTVTAGNLTSEMKSLCVEQLLYYELVVCSSLVACMSDLET